MKPAIPFLLAAPAVWWFFSAPRRNYELLAAVDWLSLLAALAAGSVTWLLYGFVRSMVETRRNDREFEQATEAALKLLRPYNPYSDGATLGVFRWDNNVESWNTMATDDSDRLLRLHMNGGK